MTILRIGNREKKNATTKVILALFLLWLSSTFFQCQAAEVRIVSKFPARLSEPPHCHIKLSGIIKPGDYKRVSYALRKVRRAIMPRLSDAPLAQFWDERFPVLCLNSPGGSYAEGLKIAKHLLHGDGTVTFVAAGKECFLSLCYNILGW